MEVLGWELQWGDKVEFLETLRKQGNDPDALKIRPRLRPWVAEYHRAFHTLSASRPVGLGGVGPIPLTELAAYLNLFGVHDYDEREAFIKMIQALDSVYLKHMHEKAEAKKPKSSKQR